MGACVEKHTTQLSLSGLSRARPLIVHLRAHGVIVRINRRHRLRLSPRRRRGLLGRLGLRRNLKPRLWRRLRLCRLCRLRGGRRGRRLCSTGFLVVGALDRLLAAVGDDHGVKEAVAVLRVCRQLLDLVDDRHLQEGSGKGPGRVRAGAPPPKEEAARLQGEGPGRVREGPGSRRRLSRPFMPPRAATRRGRRRRGGSRSG
mmetsp:Transcript_51003/g.168917  ORF Transcript_51003/g.168917 Transcript_51003/m.168917 type:complete len:201 (-) Transcript_51003:107-709(-)